MRDYLNIDWSVEALDLSYADLAFQIKYQDIELGSFGITVNLISAGFTLAKKTPHAPPQIQKAMADQTPLKRLALPIDIARAVLFYATDLSDFVTGNCLSVDGGKAMR